MGKQPNNSGMAYVTQIGDEEAEEREVRKREEMRRRNARRQSQETRRAVDVERTAPKR